MSPTPLWDRIRQRKLFQWGLAYLAGAWLVLQVLSLLAQPFAWPALAIRAATVLLAIGFFAILVVAWYHGERGAQRVNAIELVMLSGILVIAAVAVRVVSRTDSPTSALPDRVARAASDSSNSIAVLPFNNLARSPDAEPFVDGIHDDLLTQLSKIGSLRVISRTSVQEYRNTTRNVRQIAGELGVRHIVEGGVQRSGDQVRINVQLIEAATDRHVWAETYNRTLTMANVFAIQSDIAQSIAMALQTQLSPADLERMSDRPTESLEAYDAFLRGRALLERAEVSGDSWLLVVSGFERAVRLDPKFALAWANLSYARAGAYWFYDDHSEQGLRSTRAAADSALALDPRLPEAHLADGYYWYWGHRDYQRAMAAFERARALNPHSPNIDDATAVILRRQGRFAESADYFRRASVVNPRSALELRELACTLIPVGGLDEAERAARRAIVLAPDGIGNHLFLMWVLYAQERVVDAQASLHDAIQTIGPEAIAIDLANHAWTRWFLLTDTTTWRVIAGLPLSGAVSDTGSFYVMRAEWLRHTGLAAKSKTAADSARPFLERRAQEARSDWWFRGQLALSHALAGRAAEAQTAMREALATLQRAPDAWDRSFAAHHAAKAAMVLGDRDGAIAHLKTALTQPSPIPPAFIREDARFAGLRGNPRFDAIVQPLKR